MRRLTNKLKLLFYAPAVGLFLLFSPLPVQSASAQSIGMDTNHNPAGVEAGTVNCAPCGTSSVANLPEKQELLVKDEEQAPEPPEQLLFYAQNIQFSEPQKPIASYISGNLIRPPDLVKLYATFRF